VVEGGSSATTKSASHGRWTLSSIDSQWNFSNIIKTLDYLMISHVSHKEDLLEEKIWFHIDKLITNVINEIWTLKHYTILGFGYGDIKISITYDH
jgi:hypothetical protein